MVRYMLKIMILIPAVILVVLILAIVYVAISYACNELEIPSSWKNLLNEVPSTGKIAINIAGSFPGELLIVILVLLSFPCIAKLLKR